jgi:acyl dehydratase
MPLRAGDNLKLMAFEEIAVGEELPVLELVCDEEVQGRYLIALQEENPWYYKESPWGGPVAHHALLDDAPMMAAMQRYEYPFGFVHARQETEFINPLPLGKPVKIYSKVAEKYTKRGRGYIVVESLVIDQDGVEILRSRNHAMIEDERVREAAKSGLKHIPPPRSYQYKKESS